MTYLTDASLRSTSLPAGTLTVRNISAAEARELLICGFKHVGDPTCWLVWEAVSNLLGLPEVVNPRGKIVTLRSGDKMIIAETCGTDDEDTLKFKVRAAPKPLLRFRLLECQ
jgi:hypothetical protein